MSHGLLNAQFNTSNPLRWFRLNLLPLLLLHQLLQITVLKWITSVRGWWCTWPYIEFNLLLSLLILRI